MKNTKFKAYDKKEMKQIEEVKEIEFSPNGEVNQIWLVIPVLTPDDDIYWNFPARTPKECTLIQFTGFKLKGRELYTKDVIQFRYSDKIEPAGYGYCTGVIEFENGAFVVKEIAFKNYYWKSEDQRPALLYDWLRNHRCKYLGNVLESKELLKL